LNAAPGTLKYKFLLYNEVSSWTPIIKTVDVNSYNEYISVDIAGNVPLPCGEGQDHYFWRVKAIDGDGKESEWSDVMNFCVVNDTDGDGIPNDVDPDPDDNDSDDNGIPDGQEDPDNDGLPSAFELINGLDPNHECTNNHTLSDPLKVVWNLINSNNYTDNDTDGILDYTEISNNPQTDPHAKDTDDDGLNDNVDPWPTDSDRDDDGIKDGDEPTDNRNDWDSDNDGAPDGMEMGIIEMVPYHVSVSEILCNGTDSSSTWVKLFIDEDDSQTSDPNDASSPGWDTVIINGKQDPPEKDGWSVDENEYWLFQALDIGYGVSRYSSRWKNYYNLFYFPEMNRTEGYYTHLKKHGSCVWEFEKWEKLQGSNDSQWFQESGSVDTSELGLHTIVPPGASEGVHGNYYVFDVVYSLPDEDKIPRKFGDEPVKIPYSIIGIKDGSFDKVKITVKGKVDLNTVKSREYVADEQSGFIEWDGKLFSWGERKHKPQYLSGSNIYLDFEVMLKNKYASYHMDAMHITSFFFNSFYSKAKYTFIGPGFYFNKPEYNSVVLTGTNVDFEFKSICNIIDPVEWEVGETNGTTPMNVILNLSFNTPGIHEIIAKAKGDINNNDEFDAGDRFLYASNKINVIELGIFTVSEKNNEDNKVEDSTDDHNTPDETLYIVQGDSNEVEINMDFGWFPSPLPEDVDAKVRKKLLWRISGDGAANFDKDHGTFLNGMCSIKWTEPSQGTSDRVFYIYAGFDKDYCDGTLDIRDVGSEAYRRIKVVILKVSIKNPKGSAESGFGNTPECFIHEISMPTPIPTATPVICGPFRFDFQWIKQGSPGYYSNSIEGEILPPIAIGNDGINYYWEVSNGEFEQHDSGEPKKKTGISNPVYVATEESSNITLNLYARESDLLGKETKVIEVFKDHLARDYNNFGTDKTSKYQWQFEKYGTVITMPKNSCPKTPFEGTWNCFGSAKHAICGEGDGWLESTPINNVKYIENWSKIEYIPPFDATKWSTINNSIEHGDAVVFTTINGYHQHIHVSIINYTKMYAANNEPTMILSVPTVVPTPTPTSTPMGWMHPTWKWDECTSNQYYNNVNNAYLNNCGSALLYKVTVYKKP
jgi:hypothetical protein